MENTEKTPSYADIFMDKLEKKLISQALIKPQTWWRYIDDIFIIWTEGEESLQDFINYLNSAFFNFQKNANQVNCRQYSCILFFIDKLVQRTSRRENLSLNRVFSQVGQ